MKRIHIIGLSIMLALGMSGGIRAHAHEAVEDSIDDSVSQLNTQNPAPPARPLLTEKEKNEQLKKTAENLKKQIQQQRGQQHQEVQKLSPDQEKAAEKVRKVFEEGRKKEMERQDKIASEKEKFAKRVSTIRDEKKKQILLHLQEQLQHLNDKMVIHFDAVLSQITAVFTRVQERVPATTDVQTLIAKAKIAIVDATSAVSAQRQKVYTIAFEGEQFKDGVKKVREQLHVDLKAVREKIVAAREAVHAIEKVVALPTPPKTSDDTRDEKPEVVQ